MVLTLITLLTIKHFICDFPLQSFPYMYRNKGTYGHPGGILHASVHAIGTLIVLLPFTGLALILAVLDMVVHYHIDWAKMNVNAKFGWKPDNSEWFWVSLGVDQLLHYLTYIGIVYIITAN